MQWSSAHHRRQREPAALDRLRRRVAVTQAALADELAAANSAAERDALSAEIARVAAVASAIARLDAREAAVVGGAAGLDGIDARPTGLPATGGNE
jgi:hypothetical protein